MKIRARMDVHDHVVDEYDHPGLTPRKSYAVIEISFDCFRVVNDRGEPILYPKALFEVVNPSIPSHWIKQTFDDDEYFIGPVELSEIGFYNAYFDKEPSAVAKFESLRARMSELSSAE
jgi:hypothetical protein